MAVHFTCETSVVGEIIKNYLVAVMAINAVVDDLISFIVYLSKELAIGCTVEHGEVYFGQKVVDYVANFIGFIDIV